MPHTVTPRLKMRILANFGSLILFNMLLSCSVTFGSIPCPPTWETLQGTGYYVHSVPMVWAKAKEFCKQIGGNLLMPKSSAENTFADSLLKKHGASLAWLNCHRADGNWLCEVNGVGMSPPFNNPAPDQPHLEGNCVTMKTEDGKWRNTLCDGGATAVCEREEAGRRASPVMYCMTVGADGRPVADGQCVHNPALQ